MITVDSCTSFKNNDKPEFINKKEGHFVEMRDGLKLFIYDYVPMDKYASTIFIISGITGINHNNEKELIDVLSNNENRVVVIHPRGTGYSDGIRGDISNFKDFIDDYSEIITSDQDYLFKNHKVFLFGHSMSTAILLAAAQSISNIDGAILVNPPYKRKEVKGLSPSLSQYIKYACYYLFAMHIPVVNMAGDHSEIENADDRRESELRVNDPLLVKYFSMYMMTESKKVMDSMIDFSKTADYPLLLLFGSKDNLVDKSGCDLIFENWKCKHKEYKVIENGSHGKSTVTNSSEIITKWMKKN